MQPYQPSEPTWQPPQPDPAGYYPPSPPAASPQPPPSYQGGGYPPNGYAQQSYQQPTYAQPTNGQPSYGQPSYGQPGYGQPGYGDGGYGQGTQGPGSYPPGGYQAAAPADTPPPYLQVSSEARTELAKKGQRDLVFGGIWLAVGIGITVVTFAMMDGAAMLVAWGPALYGVYKIIKGLITISRNS